MTAHRKKTSAAGRGGEPLPAGGGDAGDLSLRIGKLVAGGSGLARDSEGRVVFVDGGLPGEEVEVRVTGGRRDYRTAVVTRVVLPSDDRVEPPCPYFGRCGGCQLQHLRYEAQLAAKEEILREQLQRLGGFQEEDLAAVWQEGAASPLAWGYRQRIRLHAGGGRLGFARSGSRRLVDIDRCQLADPGINEVLGLLRRQSFFPELLPRLDSLELHSDPAGGRVLLLLQGKKLPDGLGRALAAQDGVGGVIVKGRGADRVFGSGPLPLAEIGYDLDIGLTAPFRFHLAAGGFCQVNQGINREMIATMRQWLGGIDYRSVADFFCGAGNFLLPAAIGTARAYGCDVAAAGVEAARQNARRAGLAHCELEVVDAGLALAGAAASGRRFDLVLLDPPREGCPQVAAELHRLRPAAVLYISCDAATLARDLRVLAGTGFRLRRLRAFDMFPQTSHLETMALLSR
ncbi:MAG: class I SAM-dependent RNA methyltransferase [Thermodesulfobacteriota bacterium]